MNLRKAAGLLSLSVFLLTACDKERECSDTLTKTYDNTGFSRLDIGDAMEITVQQGAAFSIGAEGCPDDIDDLRVRMEGGNTLEIDYDRYRRRRGKTKISITMPQLAAAHFSGASEAKISGFAGGTANMRITLSGASEARVDGLTDQTQVELSGASDLTLKGTTEKIYGNLSGASDLHAFDAPASELDLSLSGASKGDVTVTNTLTVDATGASVLRYRGNPSSRNISTSGNSKVTAY